MTAEVHDKLKRFFNQFAQISFKKGENIINSGDEPKGIYFLASGYVKMGFLFESGNECLVNIFKPGTFFPAIWALANIPNTYFYQAHSPVVAYRVPREEFLNFIKANPDVLFDLTTRILSGIDGFFFSFKHLNNNNANGKVATALYVFSKRFGNKINDTESEIDLHLTHQEIANFIGLTRETVSLSIGQLLKKGIIKKNKGKIVICNPAILQQEMTERAQDNQSSLDFGIL